MIELRELIGLLLMLVGAALGVGAVLGALASREARRTMARSIRTAALLLLMGYFVAAAWSTFTLAIVLVLVYRAGQRRGANKGEMLPQSSA